MRSVPARPPGRPTKIEDAGPRICELLRRGTTRERSARLAGVHDSTFRAWMVKGLEEGDDRAVYRDFREAVLLAESELIDRAMASVTDAFATKDCPACGEGEPARDCLRCHGRGEVYVHELRDRTAAARFILPHRFPAEFSTRQETRHAGPDGGPVQVEARVAPLFSNEQLATMTAEQLAAAIGAFVPVAAVAPEDAP